MLLGKDAVLEQLYQVFMRSVVAAASDPATLAAKARFSSTSGLLCQVGRTVSQSVAPVHRSLALTQRGLLERQLLKASMSRLGVWRRPQLQPSSLQSSGGLLALIAKLESGQHALPMSPLAGALGVQLPRPTWQLGPASASIFGTVLGTLFVSLSDEVDFAVNQLQQLLAQWLSVADMGDLVRQCCGGHSIVTVSQLKQSMIFLAAAADICGCAIDVYTAGIECTAYRLEPSVMHPGGSGRSFRVACDASGGVYTIVSCCAVMSPAQPTIARFTLTQEEKNLKRRTDEEIAVEEENIAEAQSEVEKRKLQRITQVNRID